jgi:hypothetical protein
MRSLIFAIFIAIAAASAALAQEPAPTSNSASDIPNMGHAPSRPNGIGRLDLRVFDESGNPVQGAFAKLESKRSDGFFCESWASTSARGVAVLPPLHMGQLKLIIKAPGFQTLKLTIPTEDLAQPVRVTLKRKS